MTTEQRYERIPVFTPGDRLVKAREMAGLSQSQMAEATGISRGTVSHLELDKAPLKTSYLKLWAMATGVPVEWLETGDAGPNGGPNGPGETTEAKSKADRLAQLAASKRSGVSTRQYAAAA